MTNRRRALVLFAIASMIGVAVGCNQIFGVGDYSVVKEGGASSSSSSGSSGQPDGASCDNFDPAKGQSASPPASFSFSRARSRRRARVRW